MSEGFLSYQHRAVVYKSWSFVRDKFYPHDYLDKPNFILIEL
jgi:hypothetical protein